MTRAVILAILVLASVAGLHLRVSKESREALGRLGRLLIRHLAPWVSRTARRVVLSIRLLTLAAGIASGVAFSLIESARWDATADEVFAVGLSMSVTTALVQLISLFYDERAPRKRRRRRQRATYIVRGLQPAIARATSVPFEDVGVTVWRVQRSIWGAALQQVAQEPSAYHTGPTDIRWTRGKGVIGEAWQRGTSCYADFRLLLKQFPDGLSAEDHKALRRTSIADLRRMDLREFNAIFGKYREVLAEPIKSQRERDRGKVIGVVSIDLAMYKGLTPQDIDALPMGLGASQVVVVVGGLAVALSGELTG